METVLFECTIKNCKNLKKILLGLRARKVRNNVEGGCVNVGHRIM